MDTKRSIIVPFGALLTGCKAKDDAEHLVTHNALCMQLSTCASKAHVKNGLEAGKVRAPRHQYDSWRRTPVGDAGAQAHGWVPTLNREVWADIIVVCPVLPSYVRAASAARGAAAAAAALHKRGKYRNDVPGSAFFLPLAF